YPAPDQPRLRPPAQHRGPGRQLFISGRVLSQATALPDRGDRASRPIQFDIQCDPVPAITRVYRRFDKPVIGGVPSHRAATFDPPLRRTRVFSMRLRYRVAARLDPGNAGVSTQSKML